MQDSSDPIKQVYKTYFLNVETKAVQLELDLAPNEFVSYDDSVGLFSQTPKSFNYLTVEK